MTVSGIHAPRPTVVIADDYMPMLEKVNELLDGRFNVVSRVSDGEAAVSAVVTLRPDILILDIAMPGMDGIEAARRVREEGSPTKIIFLTAGVEPGQPDWRVVGAQGFVLKKRMRSDLIFAIEEVLAGRTFFSEASA
jgi:DNA-binding NarL/FixJ family response regulator